MNRLYTSLSRDPLPVMIFIHGGAFFFGKGSQYDMKELSTFGNVVGVTINYRLGTLGFISTDDDSARGNYGLLDQVAALKWVNENIAYFGGDPERVTIFGQSAGAASVSHLLLSTMSNQYFQRAIGISGSANSYWGTVAIQKQATRSLGLMFGCNIFNNEAMIRCLREKDASDLASKGYLAPALLNFLLPSWVPVVDGILHKDNPKSLIEAGYNSGHDIMFGSANDDAAMFTHFGVITLADTPLIRNLTISVVFGMYKNSDELVDLVFEQYPDIVNNDQETRRQALVRLATDMLFKSPAHFEVDKHSR